MTQGPLGEQPDRRTGTLKDGPADASREAALLDATWSDPPGLWGWFCAVNHKTIASRFLVTTLVFFALGGLLAAAMRLQLARPENVLMGPDLYNQVFTMHGTTMMFLFAVPVMQAMAIYLVPLMIGARSLNAVTIISIATMSEAVSVNVIICAQKSWRLPALYCGPASGT